MRLSAFFSLFLLLSSIAAWADPIQDWIDLEQLRIDRTVNEKKIIAPDIKNQNVLYRPENQNWYPLKAIWVPESELDIALDEINFDSSIKKHFIRTKNGVREFRLLVHPESEKFYQELLLKYPADSKTFRATSTASSRTVLVEAEGGPRFFAKLSLDVEIGGVTRTVPRGEVARSVGTSMYLARESVENGSFGFLPEPLGISPQGWERGGMILRTIPAEIQSGKKKLVPLFSLYAKGDDGKTILESLILKEKMKPEEFVKKFLLEPFFDGWTDWNFNKSVTMEAHAQNVLLELDENGRPSGRFIHRDLGGFNIDFDRKSEKAAGLPTFTSVDEDYHQKFSINARKQSIHTYFDGGFLYNIDRELSRIQPDYKKGRIFDESRKILIERIFKTTGTKIPFAVANDSSEFAKAVQKISHSKGNALSLAIQNCSVLFRNRRR